MPIFMYFQIRGEMQLYLAIHNITPDKVDASVFTISKTGWTALHQACYSRNFNAIEVIME